MIRLLHGMEGIPPCACGPQKLMRCKAHLLLVGHVEQQKLLLQNAKPVLRIQELIRRGESGWVSLEEVLVRGRSLRTAGTTPVPTVAPMASAGETHDSLCHYVHGTS